MFITQAKENEHLPPIAKPALPGLNSAPSEGSETSGISYELDQTSNEGQIVERKPSLIRKPRGSRRSNESDYSLYTITSCSETDSSNTNRLKRNAPAMVSEANSTEYKWVDDISKPTNFATIESSYQTELPRLSLNSFSQQSNVRRPKPKMLRGGKNLNFPNIEMKYLAKRNWINAEIKTFPMWHNLQSTNTELRNSLPSLESKCIFHIKSYCQTI